MRAHDDFCSLTSTAACLGRATRQLAATRAGEPRIRAFACLDIARAEAAVATATEGPLAGALIGAKDIIATADFPTRYGHAEGAAGPRHDAWCVARARQLGATLLGKTVCTEFAWPVPGPTRNPRDASRTPGGSSSGSAAAVAAGFLSFAFGTQTAGSTIRPASYCGVAGFKPSFGLLPTTGIQAIAPTLDHVGLFAASPRDCWYLLSAMILPAAEVLPPRPPRRLLLLRPPPDLALHDDYPRRLERLAATLGAEGIDADVQELPFPASDFRSLQQELCYWEAARTLLVPGAMRLVPELTALLAPYRAQDLSTYAAACRRRLEYQARFDAIAREYDAVLMPAATGAAPPLSETGDAVMNRFWTALHVPVASVPFWCNDAGLPLGLQLIGASGSDRALLATAQWFHLCREDAR